MNVCSNNKQGVTAPASAVAGAAARTPNVEPVLPSLPEVPSFHEVEEKERPHRGLLMLDQGNSLLDEGHIDKVRLCLYVSGCGMLFLVHTATGDRHNFTAETVLHFILEADVITYNANQRVRGGRTCCQELRQSSSANTVLAYGRGQAECRGVF